MISIGASVISTESSMEGQFAVKEEPFRGGQGIIRGRKCLLLRGTSRGNSSSGLEKSEIGRVQEKTGLKYPGAELSGVEESSFELGEGAFFFLQQTSETFSFLNWLDDPDDELGGEEAVEEDEDGDVFLLEGLLLNPELRSNCCNTATS